MPARLGFGLSEMAMLASAMEVAEERVSDHFHLGQDSWRRYPYEVRTLAELMPQEVSPVALAQVLKLRRPPLADAWRAKDFFRICLQDHNLLGLVRREGASELLLPLLTYVMAHEMVHVVRFYRFQHLFEATEEERSREEAIVHRTTAHILGRVRLRGLEQVVKLYELHREAASARGWC